SLLILDQRPGGNLEHDVGGIFSMPPASAASAAAAGGKVVLEAVVLQRVELARDLEDDVAAAPTVTAVRSAPRHELFAAKAHGTGATVPTLDEDLDAVREHQDPAR